jgi:hypothetical protein
MQGSKSIRIKDSSKKIADEIIEIRGAGTQVAIVEEALALLFKVVKEFNFSMEGYIKSIKDIERR